MRREEGDKLQRVSQKKGPKMRRITQKDEAYNAQKRDPRKKGHYTPSVLALYACRWAAKVEPAGVHYPNLVWRVCQKIHKFNSS